MRVSILSITKRPGGLDVWVDSLARQTILPRLIKEGNVEVILVDELAQDSARKTAFSMAIEQIGVEFYHHVYPADYRPKRFGKLCRASNEGLFLAEGESLFLLNDYIWIPDDTLECFLAMQAQASFPLLITARCDRTRIPPREACKDLSGPDLAYSIYQRPFKGSTWCFPHVECSWQDQRGDLFGNYHTNPLVWEASVALAPTQLLRNVGGWDEELDWGYAQDNIDLAGRVLHHAPRARIYYARDVRAIAIENKEYWPVEEGMAEAEARNQKIMNQRLSKSIESRMAARYDE